MSKLFAAVLLLAVAAGRSVLGSPLVCTVTGSTVLDFFNRSYSVSNRCTYTLMKINGSTDISLEAGFQERRREDVMFLDHLVLSLNKSAVLMSLEQGGRVLVDDQLLALNATPQLLHGVELSKDRAGVTARIAAYDLTVLFDGNTAHVAGPALPASGLCGDPAQPSTTTSLPAEKCEVEYNGTVGKTIDCNATTQHCSLLRQAAFTACHGLIDPEPFIAACTDTLCAYPAVDGLRCQFLEAYAKACSLKGNVTLGGWRSAAGCPAVPDASCLDQYCSSHEFCGHMAYGGTRCFCRAIFAAQYTPTGALGDPTVCTQNTATLTLAGCLLADKGIDYSVLHLNDPACQGRMDPQTHMVAFYFDTYRNTCRTEVTMNNSQIIYKNTVMTRNSSLYSVITRHDQVEIDFTCIYRKPDVKTLAFTIKDSTVVQVITSGIWNYTLTMNAYTDPGHQQLVQPDTQIQLNQRVWMQLRTDGLDGTLVALVTDSCWATSTPSPSDSLRHDLIIKGCPNVNDDTVKVKNNGQGTTNYFSFDMFEFTRRGSEIYLHCSLELCILSSNTCAPVCGGSRRRRSARYVDDNTAVITMAWAR